MPPAPIFNYPSDDKLKICFACPKQQLSHSSVLWVKVNDSASTLC
jgi:hypothetical protein